MFILTACGGGGCGCDGCGVAPIPGGFKIEERVANSAQIRLTDEGIGFMEDNAGDLVTLLLPDGLEFPVPPTDINQDIAVCGNTRIRVCTDGNCIVRGDISSLTLVPGAPNRAKACP